MMRTPSLSRKTYDFTTPMEGVERALSATGLCWQSLNAEEIRAEIEGRWSDYDVFFEYLNDQDAVQMTLWTDDVVIPDADLQEVSEFLVRVNEQLWIGHFSWDEEAETITYRHTFLSHELHRIDPSVLMDVLQTARLSFDRFHPFFQMLAQGDVALDQSLNVAYMDTVGEA
jgi:hypothetical protein